MKKEWDSTPISYVAFCQDEEAGSYYHTHTSDGDILCIQQKGETFVDFTLRAARHAFTHGYGFAKPEQFTSDYPEDIQGWKRCYVSSKTEDAFVLPMIIYVHFESNSFLLIQYYEWKEEFQYYMETNSDTWFLDTEEDALIELSFRINEEAVRKWL